MTTQTKKRGRPCTKRVAHPDFPNTMKLPDVRTAFVEVPGRWVTTDRDGQPALRAGAVDFLDRVRALAVTLDRPPGPEFITALREALGLTQKKFGQQLGVDKMTVSRWERGVLKPSDESLAALEDLRRRAVRRGVAIPA